MKRIAVVLMCVAAGSLALAAAPAKGAKGAKAVKGEKAKTVKGRGKAVRAGTRAPNVVGTVTYDGFSDVLVILGGSGINIGNRFNSNLGGPLLMTGQVSALTFYPAATSGYLTLFGPPNTMGTASNKGSFQFTGGAPGTFITFNLPNIAVGSDFLAGLWNGPAGFGGVQLVPETVGGQGFHAFRINTNSPGSGTGFAPIAGLNAIVRSTGNILVPVELMNFQVQ